jgi:quinol monooxygenase YgiN
MGKAGNLPANSPGDFFQERTTMSIAIVAKLKAKAGSEKQMEDALSSMVAKTREEKGCQQYILHRSNQDPTVFVFYEVYQDQPALDAHGKTPHMAEMFGKIGGLLDGRPAIDFLTELARR